MESFQFIYNKSSDNEIMLIAGEALHYFSDVSDLEDI